MKLFFSPTSPFARKAQVAIRELALADRVTEIAVNTADNSPELLQANPLGRIPALVGQDDLCLPESSLILEYLDSLHDGPRLFPADAPSHLAMRRQMAIADGVSEAVLQVTLERRKPDEIRFMPWHDRKRAAAIRALATLEGEADSLAPDTVDGFTITLGCALGYCDLRLGDYDWRADHGKLAAWFESFAARPSMRDTAPPAG